MICCLTREERFTTVVSSKFILIVSQVKRQIQQLKETFGIIRLMSSDDENIKRRLYQLENQISALSDQVWALMRDGQERMKTICDQIDMGIIPLESDLAFLRGMIGCILAELSCRRID